MVEPKKFCELGLTLKPSKLIGQKQQLRHVLEKEIIIHNFIIKPSKYPEKNERCLHLQFSIDGQMFVAFSIAKFLMETLEALPEGAMPFSTQISNKNEIYEFT